MILKREHKKVKGKLVVASVRVIKAGPTQKFTQNFIDGMKEDGLLEMVGDEILLRSDPPIKYKIVRRPGTYCCYCGIEVDPGPPALAHVAEHKAVPPTLVKRIASWFGAKPQDPDPSNPSGYRRDNFYFCERV